MFNMSRNGINLKHIYRVAKLRLVQSTNRKMCIRSECDDLSLGLDQM